METTTGVIIGRFQVPELHEGHINLIQGVLDKHQQVIIFLGVPFVHSTKHNPLSFQARKLMIEEVFGEFRERLTILPQSDQKTNKEWSRILDEKIKEISPYTSAVLYGGRDSFIPHYVGKHPTEELMLDNSEVISGTISRKEVSQAVIASSEYRTGVINAISNQYPTSYQTVDVFCIDRNKNRFLLARKADEKKWRMIGGFVDPQDQSLESAARREFAEETGSGVEVSGFQYFNSFRVDDYRYRNDVNKIMTSVFLCDYNFGHPRPSDDIYELSWFNVDDSMNEGWFIENVVDEHREAVIQIVLSLLKAKKS